MKSLKLMKKSYLKSLSELEEKEDEMLRSIQELTTEIESLQIELKRHKIRNSDLKHEILSNVFRNNEVVQEIDKGRRFVNDLVEKRRWIVEMNFTSR